MRLSRSSIRAIAISGAGLLFSILSIFINPWISTNWGTIGKVVAVVLGILALGSMITVIEWALLRLWIRKFAGEWFYTSDAKSLDPNGHVGHVHFFIRGGDIKYTVNIYTFQNAIRLANGDQSAGAESKGSAVSEAIFFDGEESLKILYNYSPFIGEGGLGLLDVTGVRNGKGMGGAYVGARKTDGPVFGLQRWYRKNDFVNAIEREFPNGLPKSKAKK
jgi:hypothetical protein